MKTDKYLEMVIEDLSANTGDDLPSQIANIKLRTNTDRIDPITGLERIERINLHVTATDSEIEWLNGINYVEIEAEPQRFNLDVDQDGEVTALGDGLMILRRLFGDIYQGQALTSKAISPESTLLTVDGLNQEEAAQRISENIQKGIDSKALDVDKDGAIKALGDGLMIIRRLFNGFEGEDLINKALGEESILIPNNQEIHSISTTEKEQIADQITDYIDTLMPTDYL